MLLEFPHLLFVPWSPNYNAKILNPNQAEAAGGFGEGRAPVQVVPPTTDLATELLAEIDADDSELIADFDGVFEQRKAGRISRL